MSAQDLLAQGQVAPSGTGAILPAKSDNFDPEPVVISEAEAESVRLVRIVNEAGSAMVDVTPVSLCDLAAFVFH